MNQHAHITSYVEIAQSDRTTRLPLRTIGSALLRAAAACSLLVASGGAELAAAQQTAPFCFGETGCPCGNASAPGAQEGCLNSTGSGASLAAGGNAWILDDTFELTVHQAPPGQNGIFIQNTSSSVGMPFYDGQLCLPIDSHLVRHYDPPTILPTLTTAAGRGRNAQPFTTGDFLGDTQPGVSIYYQFWYRDSPGYGTHCTAGANFSSGMRVTWALGGTGMVEIPGASFVMGDHSGIGDADELPLHTVQLDTFLMDTCEVTNQSYCEYLNWALAQGLIEIQYDAVKQAGSVPHTWYISLNSSSHYNRIEFDGAAFNVEPGLEEHPVVRVSWSGAAAYANWRSTQDGLSPCYDFTSWTCDFTADGYRLPTEAEWEFAARGGEQAPYFIYPWGDWLSGSDANYFGSGDPFAGSTIQTTPVGYYDGNQVPAGVDRANGYGLYDMAGNAYEWVNDRYDPTYYALSPTLNPEGPATGTERILRGGSWAGIHAPLRTADRLSVTNGLWGYSGFRLVRR